MGCGIRSKIRFSGCTGIRTASRNEERVPRVYVSYDTDTGLLSVSTEESWHGVPVEMNNSLYRQIKAANKKFWQFQDKLGEIYETSDPDHPKRVT